MSLRERIRDWKPPLFSSPVVPERMAIARKMVEEQLSNIQPNPPSELDLHLIFNVVYSHFEREKELKGLALQDIRRIPWILFTYPKNNPGILAVNTAFRDSFLGWLNSQQRTKGIFTLLFVFLRDYPTQLRSFHHWRKGLTECLKERTSSRLQSVWEKCQHFHLLLEDGPQKLAKMILDEQIPPNQLLKEAGLTNQLEIQGFSCAVCAEVLRIVYDKLSSGRQQDDLLQRFFSYILAESEQGKRLRFESSARKMAEALLLPYADNKAHWAHQKAIQSFLVEKMGDPRIHKTNWIGVNARAKEVMFGWLVEATLDMFFTILDKTADETWRYRKAFWGAYFKKGYIRQAWVILGPRAVSIARQIDDRKIKFGKLSGAAGNQSVLLMQIGDLIVSEWSHIGKCRIWKNTEENQSKIPRFYDAVASYHAFSLRRPSNFEQVHYGSRSGNWQSKVEECIRRNTNIRISNIEYMP